MADNSRTRLAGLRPDTVIEPLADKTMPTMARSEKSHLRSGKALAAPFPCRCRAACRAGLVAVWLVALALLAGCASAPPTAAWSQGQASGLRSRLLELGPGVDRGEAERLAEAAVQTAGELARQYHVVWPPWIHNTLVNAGWRDRGLCFHWANDLMEQLHGLGLWTLELRLAVAHMDTSHEHNAIVVTARSQPIAEGCVLDAWRDSGRLWFGPVATDKYPWKPLPTDRVTAELQKFLLPQPPPE